MLVSGNTPLKYKAIIIGALGYFISPIDLIPDMMPGTGFLDDASVLLYVLSCIADSITPNIRNEAKKRLHEIFEFDDNELDSNYR